MIAINQLQIRPLLQTYDEIYKNTLGASNNDRIKSIALTILGGAFLGACITTYAFGVSIAIGSTLLASSCVSFIVAHVFYQISITAFKILKSENLGRYGSLIVDFLSDYYALISPHHQKVILNKFIQDFNQLSNEIAYSGSILGLSSDVLRFFSIYIPHFKVNASKEVKGQIMDRLNQFRPQLGQLEMLVHQFNAQVAAF